MACHLRRPLPAAQLLLGVFIGSSSTWGQLPARPSRLLPRRQPVGEATSLAGRWSSSSEQACSVGVAFAPRRRPGDLRDPDLLGAGAAIAFGISPRSSAPRWRAGQPLAIAGGLALLLGVLMSPWVFRWILKLVSLPFRADGEEAPAVGMRTRLVLIPLMLAVWALLGASAVACAGAVSAEPLSATQWPLLLAATALAMAAGFAVVVMPSGLGVREWVIMEVLAPSLGSEVAVFAAVGLRVVWLVVEVLASAITYGWVEAWNRRDRPPESAP